MKIQFIGHSYHKNTNSSQFFTSILKRLGEVDFVWDEEWINPEKKLELDNLDNYDLTVIWQLPHIARKVPDHKKKSTVYVPMYDAVSRIGGKFWRRLRGMRIICFSYTNYIECKNNKLEAFYIQYYPEALQANPDQNKNSLFFWQRQKTPNWRTINEQIPLAQFDSIHLHAAIDPGNGPLVMPLDCEIKKFNVKITDWFESHADYIKALESCSTFIAPRKEEGIGMSFLEAMQRGITTIGNDAPTMNEYIVHGMNGYLTPTPNDKPIILECTKQIADRTIESIKNGRIRYETQVEDLISYLKSEAQPKYKKIISPVLEKIKRKRATALDFHNLPTLPRAPLNKKAPKVTVITVVRNDALGLCKTIESVAEQTYADFDYMIWDGCSTDQTRKIISSLPSHFATCITRSDKGPYDAMNQCAKLANGSYVIFMNAGDTFFSNRSLEFAMTGAPDAADIIYGHHIYVPHEAQPRVHRAEWLPTAIEDLKSGTLSYKWLSGIPCHQSTITRKSLLNQTPFDCEKFKIAADHNFLFTSALSGAITHHSNTIIATYHGGGMSSQNVQRCVAEWRSIAESLSNNPTLAVQFYDQGKF